MQRKHFQKSVLLEHELVYKLQIPRTDKPYNEYFRSCVHDIFIYLITDFPTPSVVTLININDNDMHGNMHQ